MNRTSSQGLLACLTALALGAAVLSTRGDEPKFPTRGQFMRQKLEFSKRVLEGLVLEDYDAISKSARALKMLSQAAEWEVPTIPNANEYISLTTEFQKLTDALRETAKGKNIDGATLAYLRLTMNCINCHKYVRDVKQ